MKKILSYFIIGALAVGATSCKKFLDINDNPNSATSTTPELVLPQAIVGTASLANNFSQSLGYPGGFFANVYGFGGYGATVTLNYGTSNFAGPFQTGYDNAEDYQYILDNSTEATKVYANSIARIMKSYIFAKIVDNYNSVPYTEALKGASVLTPKYDDPTVIYQDLVAQLNTAITNITAGQAASSTTTKITGAQDPMFGGDMDSWKKFANTLKLRLLLKMESAASTKAFATTQFASFNTALGVITEDAIVNPGYLKQGGRLAPIYGSLGGTETDARVATSILPTKYVVGFYSGNKLSDAGRGSVIYRAYPSNQSNQLGQETLASTVVPPSTSTAFYTGADYSTPGLGAVKGPSQGAVVMLLAEANFLKAEAYLFGYLSGNAKTAFEDGIVASFRYLYKNQAGTVDGTMAAQLVPRVATPTVTTHIGEIEALAAYKDANLPQSTTAQSYSYLVDWDLTTAVNSGDLNKDVTQRRLEAIITQKYIALNLIAMDEAFAEYRRTTYPYSSPSTANAFTSMASLQSRSTSPDKLLTRLPYPQTEYNVNGANVPQNVDIFSAKVFWDNN